MDRADKDNIFDNSDMSDNLETLSEVHEKVKEN